MVPFKRLPQPTTEYIGDAGNCSQTPQTLPPPSISDGVLWLFHIRAGYSVSC